MERLTDGRRTMLASAAARRDGAVAVPKGAGRTGVARVAAGLITRRFLRECVAKAGQPVWREDQKGKRLCLIVTKAGRAAVGKPEDKKTAHKSSGGKEARAGVEDLHDARHAATARPGTKRALLVAMLSSEQGATLDDLIAATGWLPHTTRAALTGLRKSGHAIERRPSTDGRGSNYRIVTSTAGTA